MPKAHIVYMKDILQLTECRNMRMKDVLNFGAIGDGETDCTEG